jgi:hypothetical protein
VGAFRPAKYECQASGKREQGYTLQRAPFRWRRRPSRGQVSAHQRFSSVAACVIQYSSSASVAGAGAFEESAG